MLKLDNQWLLLFYLICYLYDRYLFHDCYNDKNADEHMRNNYYYVPIKQWLERWYFRMLLRKNERIEEYPESDTGTLYLNYRILQCTIVLRTLIFPLLAADITLFICQSRYAGICVVACTFLHFIIEIVFAYPVTRHDVKRLKSYEYIVANDDETVLSDARRKPPALWKLNTLLDVFFYFGEARIRYCESGNYLVYRQKNGGLLYIFLKESFETMPEIHYEPYDWRRYNPAMGIWVDEIIAFDGNMQNDNQRLKMKNIKTQDMPENIC